MPAMPFPAWIQLTWTRMVKVVQLQTSFCVYYFYLCTRHGRSEPVLDSQDCCSRMLDKH